LDKYGSTADQVEVSWQVIRICFRISTDIIGYANKVSCWPGTSGTSGTSGTNYWELQEQVVLQVQGILIVSWHVIRMLPTKFRVGSAGNFLWEIKNHRFLGGQFF